MRYRLWCVFRVGHGWQWPLREGGDYLEVRDLVLGRPIAIIPAEMLEAVIAHHLDGFALQMAVGQSTEPPARPPRKPLARSPVDDPERRRELRTQRRSRRAGR